jgi:hypothetical protein
MTLNHDVSAENAALRKIIRDTLWMACRYAHGRQSYAVAMYNDAAREADKLGALENRPAKHEPIFAIDGTLTRELSGLTQAEFEAAWTGWHDGEAIPNHCRAALMKEQER